MATIKDVASLAGVSIGTVSNYLNHTKPVSREVSEKIQQAIDLLKYTPNQYAKNLKSKLSTDIGIILPSLNDSYYVQIFQGIKSCFQNTDYYMNLAFSENIPEFETNIVTSLLKKQICGLFLVSCQPDNWKFYYDNLISKHIPMVLIDRNIRSLDTDFVSFDNRVLLKDMVESLLRMDFRRIYLMSGPEKFDCEAACMRGFSDAYKNYGMNLDEKYFIQTELSKEDAFRKTIKLLNAEIPEVIVTTSESLTAGVIEGITILGYTTDDIPVFTLGEEHWNLHTHSFSSGSTVRPAIKLGQTASRLLIEQLNSPLTKETERVILSGRKFSSMSQPASGIRVSPKSMRMPEKESSSPRRIRALLLDTPQVHYLLRLLRNFEIRTGTTVEATILPHHFLYETILENHSSGQENPYDVIMYDIPWMPSLASEHILADISKEISSLDTKIFLPDCLKYYSIFSGRFYGIPFMYAPQILYYRKDLFEDPELKADYKKKNKISLRPPVTLKEFNTIADFFTNKTSAIPYGISVPTAYSECLTPEIYMRLRAFGGNLFTPSGQVCLDCDQSLKAYINFVRSIKYAKPDYRTATDNSAVDDFLAGETAMLISYPSFLRDVTDLRKNSIVGSIGYHLIPGRAPLLGGWSLGISSQSKNKDAAFEFLKWTCEKQITNYSILTGSLPATNSSYLNDELGELYPWLPLYHDIYKYTKPTFPPKLANNKVVPQYEIDEIVCKWIYKLLESEIKVQETITNTHEELKELVQKYLK
ncbi:MAG: extracellular solute-binding protein [Faecalicatena sp.]|uniref:extracellular solute-binding protein n=1 Tax=Faecalicatena sp. TaxID=2005360 RepID=UPI002584B273|nr:extracellular solute-binding protein [Faecalicatena sp.]MCI6466245.1 extracellular solute-binding protein [Faecalicatena sp.]MDY5620945.1 extracellular solute-binding protein [Lachnospiraceae bacterium]